MMALIFHRALAAQFLGVLIALFAFFGLWRIEALDAAQEIYATISFLLAFIVFFAVPLLRLLMGSLNDQSMEKWIIRISYGDVICLGFLVLATGGTRGGGSIYTAIFLIMLPTVAAFLSTTNYHEMKLTVPASQWQIPKHVSLITFIAVVVYVASYIFISPLNVVVDQEALYNFWYSAVAVSSIIFSVWVVLWHRSLITYNHAVARPSTHKEDT